MKPQSRNPAMSSAAPKQPFPADTGAGPFRRLSAVDNFANSAAAGIPRGNAIPRPPPPFGPPPHAGQGFPFPVHFADPAMEGIPPPPHYGFENLERRSITMSSGTVRHYFALPPDPSPLPGLLPPPEVGFLRQQPDRRPLSPERRRLLNDPAGAKRKREDEIDDGLRGILSNGNRSGGSSRREDDWERERKHELDRQLERQRDRDHDRPRERDRDRDRDRDREREKEDRRASKQQAKPDKAADEKAVRSAFFQMAKAVHEKPQSYLSEGKDESIWCIACSRRSKKFVDTHSLICHAYSLQRLELRTDHLGLHKALCVLMGWDYSVDPSNKKQYQALPADVAESNRRDLILWPPIVVINNTWKSSKEEKNLNGISSREMEAKLKEMGFHTGKAKPVYGKDGSRGITVVKFEATQAGLSEAVLLAEFFEKEGHGRDAWGRANKSGITEEEKSSMLFHKHPETGELTRIFYGYLATASDLDSLDSETRKRSDLRSRKELEQPKRDREAS